VWLREEEDGADKAGPPVSKRGSGSKTSDRQRGRGGGDAGVRVAMLGHDCGVGNGPREGRENACAGAKRRERGKENWAGSNRPMREKEVRERRRECRPPATDTSRETTFHPMAKKYLVPV